MHDGRAERLDDFARWVDKHIKGDEKGEAQVFLDRLFRAFGHEGIKEAGATLEERVKKEDGRGTSFADLVWKPFLLVEMKKRGEDLAKHFRQAFDYWTRLVPGRPRYVVLCNFDELWVYDFDTQIDSPLDKVKVADLARRWGPLAFLFPKPETPRFGNDQVAVTRKAADHLAECFNKMTVRGVDRGLAQRFVLQLLVSLFAEDIGLLDRYFVARLLDECTSKQESYDLLGELFDAMNTPGKTPGGRFKGVEYFNGGLSLCREAQPEATRFETGTAGSRSFSSARSARRNASPSAFVSCGSTSLSPLGLDPSNRMNQEPSSRP